MIDAKELRIGNWLKVIPYDDDYAPYNDQVDAWLLCLLVNGKEIDTAGYEPISLTPEILEQCGFEKDDSDDTRWSLYFDHPLETYSLRFGFYDFEPTQNPLHLVFQCNDPYYNSDIKHIKYLHQLQNLYYALTGKELEIKQLA